MNKIISTTKAPKAIGPYSQAVRTGNLIFTAGQLGIDPESGILVEGDIKGETLQALTNIKEILEAEGSSLEKIIKTTVFLRDMNDFSLMNTIYASFFSSNPPARSTVQVAALPKNAAVEIEAIASV